MLRARVRDGSGTRRRRGTALLAPQVPCVLKTPPIGREFATSALSVRICLLRVDLELVDHVHRHLDDVTHHYSG